MLDESQLCSLSQNYDWLAERPGVARGKKNLKNKNFEKKS